MRVIVVSGASRGLGRAIALRFGAERVALFYRRHDSEAEQVRQQIEDMGGEAFCCRMDVGVPEQVRDAVEKIIKRWGRIDILVNNAGIASDGLLIKMDESRWDEVLRTNLSGPMNLMRAVVPFIRQNGGGHIVNIGSVSGFKGREGQINYAASKGGLWGLTVAAAMELGVDNIKVNMVLPGLLDTGLGRALQQAARERIMKELCLGRTSTMEEVADFINYLCGMENISGQVFNLDSRVMQG